MNQVHVAHAYRRARQVNLLHPAKQEPGQVQIANHEWMILLSVCDPRAQRFIREQKAAHSSAPPQAGGTHTAYFAAMSDSAEYSLQSGSASRSPSDSASINPFSHFFAASPEPQASAHETSAVRAEDQKGQALSDDDVTVQCQTFICQGTDVNGIKCKRRLGPGTHTRGACCIIHHEHTLLKCIQCSRSYVHEGCFIRVQCALVPASVTGTCQSWQCDGCISGISASSDVKKEYVQDTSGSQIPIYS